MSLVCSLCVSSEMMSKLSPLHDKSTKCEQCMNQMWTVMTVHNKAVVQMLCISLCLLDSILRGKTASSVSLYDILWHSRNLVNTKIESYMVCF